MFGLQQGPFTQQLFLFRSVFHFHIFETLEFVVSNNMYICMYQKSFLRQVRQGVTQTKQQTQPGKYANTELMKVGHH